MILNRIPIDRRPSWHHMKWGHRRVNYTMRKYTFWMAVIVAVVTGYCIGTL